MDFLSGPVLEKFISDLSFARMVEAYIIFTIVWRKFKPHLTKIEERMAGLETAVRDGFKMGEVRFEQIENRVSILESKGVENDKSMGHAGLIGQT